MRRDVVIHLNPWLLLRVAGVAIALLVVTSVVVDLLTPTPHNLWWRAASLDSEASVATLYAILQLACCAAAAFVVGYARRRNGLPWAGHWFAVSALLALVAVDEEIGWHEELSTRLERAWDTGGVFRYAWVIPGLVIVAALAVVFLRFVRALPPPIRSLVVAAAVIFVAGAVGLEMIGGDLVEDGRVPSTAQVVVSTTEETLELVGVALMGYAISRYLVEFLEPVSLTSARRDVSEGSGRDI